MNAPDRRLGPPRLLGLDARERAEHCNAQHCQRATSGAWLCVECKTAELGPEEIYHCAPCSEQRGKRAAEAARQQAIERRINAAHVAFNDCMRGGRGYTEDLTYPPRWEFARFENQEFRRRAAKKVVAAVERWTPQRQGCLLVSAPTGAGKTASALAWLFRMRDALILRIRAGEEVSLSSFGFITGHELANCRRRWQIGEESPLVSLAIRVEVLVLDDFGCEPWPNEEFQHVLDRRFRAERRTLVTTGLTVAAFRARYEGAIYRRLIEPGIVVEVTR